MNSQFLAIVIILLLLFFVVKPKRNLVGGSGESMFSTPNFSGNNRSSFFTAFIIILGIGGLIYLFVVTGGSSGSIPI